MYKGKFDQKTKGPSNVHDIVSQRNAAPQADVPAAPAPQKKAAPQVQKNAQRPAPVQEAAAPKRKGPRLGSVIFYTIYFMFILVFFIATYIGLQWLQGWLTDYEAAQPTVKAEQVFTQLFTDPNWGALYESAGAKDSAYEGKDAYVSYMEEKVGSSKLNYLETSAGLSQDKKFVVRLDNEKVATFTLVDKNAVGETSLENIGGELPDWQLGRVEVFFEREETYFIQMLDGHTAYVNDVPLTDDHTIQIATTMAHKYLPEGTTGASVNTQQITGLMGMPTVSVLDEDGNVMTVTYDEATRTFTERTEANTILPEQEEVALNAAKAFCLWMIEEGNRADIAKYYDSSSEVYKEIIRTTELWMQNHNGYRFKDEKVTDFALYNDNLFSVRVSLILEVTRTDGTTRDYDYATSLFFNKNSGSWKVFDRTNVDVSQPVGKVRLTFMHGDTQLTTNFFETNAKEIITPIISPVPEGQVFSGWVRQTENEDGQTVLTVMFQPDETGKVVIPEGTTIEPMVLYALFEDADAAAAASTEGA